MAKLDTIERAALIVAFIVSASLILRWASEPRWKKFVSEEGAFSVLMPEKPKPETKSFGANGILEIHSFSASSRTNTNFNVSFFDAPAQPLPGAGEQMLDAQRQSLTHGDESRMLSAEKLTVNGFPVRQYKAIAEDGSQADEKLYLVRRRMYILLVVHDRDRDEDEVKKFFDSFTFQPRE